VKRMEIAIFQILIANFVLVDRAKEVDADLNVEDRVIVIKELIIALIVWMLNVVEIAVVIVRLIVIALESLINADYVFLESALMEMFAIEIV